MNIHFLGTGSAYPGKERDNTSFCIDTRKEQVLIDVSGNPCRKLKQFNIDLCSLDSVILTHFHIDHVYGLPSLLWGMWLENRTKPLSIFCHQENKDRLQNWFTAMEIDTWGIEFPIEVKTFSNEDTLINSDELEIRCFPAIHSVPTVGLEIQWNNKRIVFSGDSEINPHIQAFDHIDLLIHEVTNARKKEKYHTNLLEIAESYNLEKITKIIAIHLSDEEPYEDVLHQLKLEDKITFADDLMTITI